jgi:hypothetical protein
MSVSTTSSTSNEHKFKESITWACEFLFKGKFTKAKQIALQAIALVGAGIHTTTGYSKVLDPFQTRSSAANPKMHSDDKF